MKVYRGKYEALIQAETHVLCMLAAQTACCIIQACQELPTDTDTLPTQGASAILAKSMNWSENALTNALQSHVNLLYALAELFLEDRLMLPMDWTTLIPLMARAFSAYQEWKTAVCRKEEEKMGKGWGSALEFYQRDWTALNEKLLAAARA